VKPLYLGVNRRVLSLIFLTSFLKGFYGEKNTENKTGFGQNTTPISTYCSQVADLLTAKPLLESFLFQDVRQKPWTS